MTARASRRRGLQRGGAAPPRRGRLIAEAVRFCYRTFGCVVESTSQFRPSRVTRGLPDLFVFHFGLESGVRLWCHESKGEGGVLSLPQRRWRAMLEAAGITVVVGGVDEARAQLASVGLVDIDATGALHPTPLSRAPIPVFGLSLAALSKLPAAITDQLEAESARYRHGS